MMAQGWRTPGTDGAQIVAERRLPSGYRLDLARRKTLLPVHGNGPVDDRPTVNAFPGIEDEEKVGEPLQHHKPFASRTFHVTLPDRSVKPLPDGASTRPEMQYT